MTAAGTPPGKAWSGRFAEGADPAAEAFTASLSFDRRLWPYDLAGSAAWARALARAKLITEAELESLLAGLDGVRRELEGGTFPFRRELEDIHMNVERRLIEVAGPVGGKLHTGRSRNDQIALDERLYLRDILDHVDAGLVEVERALVAQAERHPEAPMPGYTHLQRAQPVLLAHHLLAYVFMLERDRARFRDGRARVNVMPLGAAALAGAAFAIDREALARDLGFSAPSPNSMDAVADRDFVLEFLADAAILGMHCSRLAADLTLWATSEFGFVEFSDAFATGSSIMPQKKNPDVAELIRGKTGRLYGNLTAGAHRHEGAPPHLQLGHAGGQGAALRHGRHARGDLPRAAPDARLADLPDRPHAGRGGRALLHRHRSGGLSRPPGPALPRRARGRRPGGAPRHHARGGAGRPAARGAAPVLAR